MIRPGFQQEAMSTDTRESESLTGACPQADRSLPIAQGKDRNRETAGVIEESVRDVCASSEPSSVESCADEGIYIYGTGKGVCLGVCGEFDGAGAPRYAAILD